MENNYFATKLPTDRAEQAAESFDDFESTKSEGSEAPEKLNAIPNNTNVKKDTDKKLKLLGNMSATEFSGINQITRGIAIHNYKANALLDEMVKEGTIELKKEGKRNKYRKVENNSNSLEKVPN